MTFFGTLTPRDIEDREEFQDAERFRRTITPLEDTEYKWIFDYANDKHDKLTKIYKELDDKANEIVKYLGGGAGLVSRPH